MAMPTPGRTPDDDLNVANPFVLGGQPNSLAEQVARGDKGILNLLGQSDKFAHDYSGLREQDPTKAMLKTSEAMLGEIKEQTRYMRDTVEMMRQANEMTAKQADVMREAVRQASADTLATLQGQVPASGPAGAPTVTGAGHPMSNQGAAGMQAPGFPSPADRSDPDLEAARQQQMQDRFFAARDKPIETLRTEFFGNVSRRVSEWEPKMSARFDTVGAEAYDRYLATGDESELEVMEASMANAARVERLSRGARNVAGNLAEKGLKGGLLQTLAGSGLARVAGTGALAYGVADKGLEFAEEQREANRAYQSATGDSNFGGFAFRTRQNLFGLTQRGQMGSANAQALYGAVTMMNTDEQTRAEALDFASDAFTRFGMSVQESVQMIEQAIQRGETNFSQLTRSLDAVTASAAAANVNAEQARANFNTQLQRTMDVFGGGTGSTVMAQIGAQFQTSLGPQFADNRNFDPLTNDLNVLSYAQSAGMDRGQVTSAIRQNDRDVIMGLSQQADATAERFLGGVGRDSRSRIQQSIAEAARRRGMTVQEFSQQGPAYRDALLGALDTERTTHGSAGLDPIQLQQLATAMGADPSNPEEAELFAMNYLAGNGAQQQATAALQQDDDRLASLGMKDLSSDDIGSGFREKGIRDDLGIEGNADLWFSSRDSGEYRDDLVDTYGDALRAGGTKAKRSGVVEEIIKGAATGEQFVVDTKDGERVVSAEDAIRYFSDQLQSGTARYFGGSNDMRSVSQVLGFEEGEAGAGSIMGDETASAENEGLSKLGVSREDAARKQREEAGLSDTITVVPGPGLVGPDGRPLFEFLWNMDVTQANQQGVPAPANPGR